MPKVSIIIPVYDPGPYFVIFPFSQEQFKLEQSFTLFVSIRFILANLFLKNLGFLYYALSIKRE